MRTENCRGSAGGSNSLPSPSSTWTAPAAASTAAATTSQRSRSRARTKRSTAPKAQPRGRASSSPGSAVVPMDAAADASAAGSGPAASGLARGSSQRDRAGISMIATTSEAPREAVTVKAMPSIRRAARPWTKSTGRKTTQVVSVEAAIAPATSPVPLAAVSAAEAPGRWRRWMLSTTTIALSTSMPAPSASPARVMMLRECSHSRIANRATNRDTGTAEATTTVGPRERRNSARTTTARAMPMSVAFSRSSIASSTRAASSVTIETLIRGRSRSRSARAARTVRETSTVLAPASLNTWRPTPSWPFTRTRWSISAWASSTSATSETRIG